MKLFGQHCTHRGAQRTPPGQLVAALAIGGAVAGVLAGQDSDRVTTTNPVDPVGFKLIATDYWEPPPPPPPPPAAPAPAPAPVQRYVPPEPAPPPSPPPPPPPVLVMRLDEPVTAAFVSMTNHENLPPVGCTMRTVALGGPAAMVNYGVPEEHFTVTGGQESRIPAGGSIGPPTGSTWRLTVTCDNGLSTSLDKTY